jgi:hypothetical protein
MGTGRSEVCRKLKQREHGTECTATTLPSLIISIMGYRQAAVLASVSFLAGSQSYLFVLSDV